MVGSRFTHAAESRYAPIEGEALAVTDAQDKACYFVLGCGDLIVAVDHKPLLKLLGDRALDDIPNPRLRKVKEKTLPYRFHIIHVRGMKNRTVDAVLCRPVGTPGQSPMDLPDDNVAIVTHLLHSTNVLSFTRWMGPVNDDIVEGDLTWCAAGLESPLSVMWDRVSDDDMRTLKEIAAVKG